MSEITKENIEKRAYYISLQHKSFDQLIWTLAETELQLASGVKPTTSQVRSMAESIAKNKPQIDEVNWLLAEKQLIYERKQQQQKF